MNKIVYHGSNIEVYEPKLNFGVRALDFGRGFYTTENYTQAKEWALKRAGRFGNVPIISKFAIDLTDLSIKDFGEVNIEWLDLICKCRKNIDFTLSDEFDVIIGAVADDTIYTVIGLYENNSYDFEDTIKRLKINPLYSQLCICSEKGISKIKFLDSEVVTDVGLPS